MKTCPQCKTSKSLSEFYNKTALRKQSFCKECQNKYSIQRWIERKKKAIIYLGSTCNDCGNSYHYAAMQFHHIDPSQKDCDWGKLRLKSWDKITAELDKCKLLCANCHAVKGANE